MPVVGSCTDCGKGISATDAFFRIGNALKCKKCFNK